MADIVLNDISGTGTVTLKKINQDAYSGEYFKRNSNTEYRMKVRHTQENVKSGARPVMRHNVEYTVTEYQTDGTPPIVYQAYFVVRHNDVAVDAKTSVILGQLNSFLGSGDITALLGWETDLTV